MSFADFIPTVWVATILENLNDEHVFADVFNRDYEGEIRGFGDTVRINSVGRINVNTYTRNSTSITVQDPDSAGQGLVINKSNYFAFRVDNLDKAQAQGDLLSKHMVEASWGMSDTIDSDLATILWAGVLGNATAETGNRISDRVIGTGGADEDAYEMLIDLGVKLTENNVPRSGRWIIVPPWFEGVLALDPRTASFGTAKNRDTFKNGRVSGNMVAGFDLRVSNNVTTSGSAYRIVAGYRGSATFAEQLDKIVAFSPESSFHDAMKGLHLYGRKVVRPSTLASVQATPA